jgi:hypothetical protein
VMKAHDRPKHAKRDISVHHSDVIIIFTLLSPQGLVRETENHHANFKIASRFCFSLFKIREAVYFCPVPCYCSYYSSSLSPRCCTPTRSCRTVSVGIGKEFHEVFSPTTLLILFYTALYVSGCNSIDIPSTNYNSFSL